MRKYLVIALLSLLTACVTPAPIENPQDAIAQAYTAETTVAQSVANAQTSGLIDGAEAQRLKLQLQSAHDFTDYAAHQPVGSTAQQTALQQAQAALNLIRQTLTSRGAQ